LGLLLRGPEDRLERGPEMNMKDEAELGLAVHWVQQALFSAYEDNCPFRPVKTGRQSLRWTSELESLRREVRRLLTSARQITIRIVGNFIERLSRDIERRYERLPKRLGELSVALLITYLDQLGYTGLYLGTLRSGWDFWWLLLLSVRNLRGKPWISCLLLTSPPQWLYRGMPYPPLLTAPNVWTGRWLRRLSPMGEWYG
jgi:hypothetical protein